MQENENKNGFQGEEQTAPQAELQNNPQQPKPKKWKRRLLAVGEWLLYVGAGGVVGFAFDSYLIWLAILLPYCLVMLLFFHWLKTKKLAHWYEDTAGVKADSCADSGGATGTANAGGDNGANDEDDDIIDPFETPEVKVADPLEIKGPGKFLILILQILAGGLFGFSVVSLIFELIDNCPYSESSFGFYLALLGGSVVIFGISLAVHGVFDGDVKKAFTDIGKDIKNTENDERMIVCAYKAGYISMFATLAMLLIFGAAAAVFEFEAQTVLVGILVVAGAGFFVYMVALGILMESKNNPMKAVKVNFTMVALSIIPVALMAARWILEGLSSVGIAFFVAFVVVSVFCFAEAVAQKKISKK